MPLAASVCKDAVFDQVLSNGRSDSHKQRHSLAVAELHIGVVQQVEQATFRAQLHDDKHFGWCGAGTHKLDDVGMRQCPATNCADCCNASNVALHTS